MSEDLSLWQRLIEWINSLFVDKTRVPGISTTDQRVLPGPTLSRDDPAEHARVADAHATELIDAETVLTASPSPPDPHAPKPPPPRAPAPNAHKPPPSHPASNTTPGQPGHGTHPTRPRPPEPLPQIMRPEDRAGRRAQRLRLCMDFGTSACAVGWAARPRQFELANLAQAAGQTAYMVESVFAVPVDAAGQAVLGSHARNLQESRKPEYQYYRSLKRLLSDGRSDAKATKARKRALTYVICELLLLAICPEQSGTLAIVQPDPAQRKELAGELGIRDFPVTSIPSHGVELFLSVPNAFGAYECEIIQEAAKEALARSLDALGRSLAWKDRVPDRPPKMIREAEAVVWWEVTQGDTPFNTQRILVFDVGGGSSDAALVAATRDKYRVRVETLRHSGVTFGGNDVDELLLKVLQDQINAPDALSQIAAKIGTMPSRIGILTELEVSKANWSTMWNLDMANQGLAEPWQKWVEAMLTPECGSFDPIEDAISVIKFPGSLHIPSHGNYQERLGSYLRGTVGTIVDDLFPNGGDDNKVDRVILSGRGSLLPGLRQALAYALVQRGVINSADQIGLATPEDSGDRDYMKLACVRGICRACFDSAMERGLSHFVSHQVTYKLGTVGKEVSVWPARTRLLPGGEARALMRLTEEHESLYLEFSQRRFPVSIRTWFGSADEWSSRQVAAIDLPSFSGQRHFLIHFDCAAWILKVWELRPNRPPLEIENMLPQNPPGRTNPITGMPFGWGDEP